MQNNSDNDKRHYHRISFIGEIHVSLEDQTWLCELLDISLKGLLIDACDSLEVNKDSLYNINLILNEDNHIAMQAKLVHAEDNHLGFQWVDIDLDSLSTLKRLLEFNLNDPGEINRELAELIHTQI